MATSRAPLGHSLEPPPPPLRRHSAALRRRSPWLLTTLPAAAFELLSRLPKHGLGSNLSRTGWTDDCYWTIEKVKVSPVRLHGPAADGVAAPLLSCVASWRLF